MMRPDHVKKTGHTIRPGPGPLVELGHPLFIFTVKLESFKCKLLEFVLPPNRVSGHEVLINAL